MVVGISVEQSEQRVDLVGALVRGFTLVDVEVFTMDDDVAALLDVSELVATILAEGGWKVCNEQRNGARVSDHGAAWVMVTVVPTGQRRQNVARSPVVGKLIGV